MMLLEHSVIEAAIKEQNIERFFSGVLMVRQNEKTVYEGAFGFANRADQLPNKMSTRFGIASGTKTFTSIAVCRLVEQGKLTFDTRLVDCVQADFPHFDPTVTVKQLLTHTSGVPDYFDEEELDSSADFGTLWDDLPVYKVREPKHLLPLFQNLPMKFPPGQRFSYNNGGFILLGLVIEAISGMPYATYVEEHVLASAGMSASGFFEMDNLPANTAFGYLPDGRTNIFQIPIKGMSDGGVFVTAPDMAKFWKALFGHQLLPEAMTTQLLHPHAMVDPTAGHVHYGYGIWIHKEGNGIRRYYSQGEDPGVSFVSAAYPALNAMVTVIGNTESGAWPVFDLIEELLGAHP